MAPDVHHHAQRPRPTAQSLPSPPPAPRWHCPSPQSHAAGGTTYYVSPAGSDSNNGTAPGSAIQTLGRASGLQLNPGDKVLLQRGATFSGKLAVWRVRHRRRPDHHRLLRLAAASRS